MNSTSPRIKISAEVAGAAAVIAAVAVAVGAFVWNRKTRRNVRRLTTRSLALGADRNKDKHSCDERKPLTVLPAPVVHILSSPSQTGSPRSEQQPSGNWSSPRGCEFCMDSLFGGGAFFRAAAWFHLGRFLPNGAIGHFPYSRQLHRR